MSSDILPESGPSTHPDALPLCSMCSKTAIYTCPGCAVRTCSAACSSTHKAKTGCTGTRNRAAYVPMNDYGFGTLMNDYTYLEDVGRKVGDWGREIVRERLLDVSGSLARGSGGRGRGGMRGRGRPVHQHGGKAAAKREQLRRHLDLWDIEMDLLPVGMAKAQTNKSTWDFKLKKPLLTVEFIIHAPPPPLQSQTADPPWTLLTHQNKLDEFLLGALQRHIRTSGNRKNERGPPEWVSSLALPTPEDPEGFILPEMFLPAPSHDGHSFISKDIRFYVLDVNQTLSTALRGTGFVEYPTIHVYAPGTFKGTIVNRQGVVTRVTEEERPAKRRRTDKKKSTLMMKGLVGGYGSDGETNEDDDALAILAEYAASDDGKTNSDSEQAAEGLAEDTDYRTPLASVSKPDIETGDTVEEEDASDPDIFDEDEDEEADRQLLAELERRNGLQLVA